MSDLIRVDVRGASERAIGSEHGVTAGELRGLAPEVRAAHKVLLEERRAKRYGFYDLHRDTSTRDKIRRTAEQFLSRGVENFVVLGIGGSALGTTALATALRGPYYNLLPPERRNGFPRLFVVDNVDPVTMKALFEICPPESTVYNVISKSGSTAETVTQLLIVLERLKREVGEKRVKDHLVVTTGPAKNSSDQKPLAYARRTFRCEFFVIPPNVGGRFSVFSPVGLFPAAMAGMDIEALAKGCGLMDEACRSGQIEENPAYLLAAHHVLYWRRGKPLAVMMPYADALRDVADWFRQLWAESLGKSTDLEEQPIPAVGPTPIKALGVTDQHSQLQLYLEGPNDKLITVLETNRFSKRLPIPDALPKLKEVSYLKGRSMNDLMVAERDATIECLRRASRPVIRIKLPRIDESTVAQLLYMMEVQTAMAGRLLGVNAFDQPAVELIKVLTRKALRQKGGKR